MKWRANTGGPRSGRAGLAAGGEHRRATSPPPDGECSAARVCAVLRARRCSCCSPRRVGVRGAHGWILTRLRPELLVLAFARIITWAPMMVGSHWICESARCRLSVSSAPAAATWHGPVAKQIGRARTRCELLSHARPWRIRSCRGRSCGGATV